LPRSVRGVTAFLFRRPHAPTLFPYTTLFRSEPRHRSRKERDRLSQPDQARLQGLPRGLLLQAAGGPRAARPARRGPARALGVLRSEEHTSELQSRVELVCRLLLELTNTQITE